MLKRLRLIGMPMIFLLAAPTGWALDTLVNWETPHVHPLELTPSGSLLLAVNTPDARLEVFDVTTGMPVRVGAIPVGLDPVSVRAWSDSEVWVVNRVSDSVSIVDLSTMNVVMTIATLDEPADVVFAGDPVRAFVSCGQANTIQVFDPDNPSAPIGSIPIDAEEPRAMAVSPDGLTVYVAVFESGNGSTALGGGLSLGVGTFPPNAVNDPLGPYGGQNPPPNDGALFDPPMQPGNPPPPAVGMIVRKNAADQWMDDNGGDWTDLVSGPLAGHSGRPVGWDLPDRDVAIIDTTDLSVTYATRLMNICMAIGVNPATGMVTVVGTDATNEIRFEPVLSGRFIRVHAALVDPEMPDDGTIVDLNDHLTYTSSTIPQVERDKSLGDPRGIVWNNAGTTGYVTGMGSNNVIVIDASGSRAGLAPTIEVGEGPTGIVLNEALGRIYVLDKFESAISVIDTTTELEIARVPVFDPSPIAIKLGRRHLYDTHETGGLGHIACASCHIDSRMDRIAWDLGNPAGDVKPFDQNCNFGAGALIGAPACEDWHPMKGPMMTQTLQDIIGKEPHHWRGDRNGIEEFNGAFVGLLGDDELLTDNEMQEFEDFLATIVFPPNPFREFDNSLPTTLPLPGHFTTGRFAPAGQPLPDGNAIAGLFNYRTGDLDGVDCVTCHTLPTGMGTNLVFSGGGSTPFPTGPNGEMHHALVSVDGSTNVSIKIPHLRNLYQKVGFDATQISNRAGFGLLHDGSVDSIARFVSEPVFSLASVQEVADLVALMLAFSGSDLPTGSTNNIFELLGPTSNDTHAAVGRQVTFDGTNNDDPDLVALFDEMLALDDANAVGIVAKGVLGGLQRGAFYSGAGNFQLDRLGETITADDLRTMAAAGGEMTFTVVPHGTQLRIGVDRDEDGFWDRDELDACSNPADANSIPGKVVITGDYDGDGLLTLADYAALNACMAGPDVAVGATCACTFDFDLDGDLDTRDYAQFSIGFDEP